jgi:hypothetical protein
MKARLSVVSNTMSMRRTGPARAVVTRRWPILLMVCLLVGACDQSGGPSTPLPDTPSNQAPTVTPEQASPDAPTRPPADPPAATPGAQPTDPPAAVPPTETAAALPQDVWRTAELRDVRSGETLVVNELVAAGRLVVIEPMAIWCTSCRTQQNEARTALAQLARDDIVYISLDVDPNETEPDLARYADERDYPWHFAVASREVARSLAQAFGDQVLSPPSTPKIVVQPAGQAEVSFGVKRAEQLEAEFAALLP